MWYRRAACPAPQVNRAFLERCNEVETTFETSGSESAPASAASVRATSTAAEGETSPGSADVRNAETKAARKRAAELESERQQGVVYYDYKTYINETGMQLRPLGAAPTGPSSAGARCAALPSTTLDADSG